MNKSILFILLLSVSIGYCQVGINTTTPNAQLEIKSSNEATPTNTDGIIIPRVDTFPSTNPTVAQNGMMVYLTTPSGSNQSGFYYWDNSSTSWIGINSTKNADADFFEVGGTNAPDNINDEIYHLGKVKIGNTTNIDGKLEVVSDESVQFGIRNQRNLSPSAVLKRVGIYNEINGNSNAELNGNGNDIFANGDGIHYGTTNYLSGSGIGDRVSFNSILTGASTGSITALDNTFLTLERVSILVSLIGCKVPMPVIMLG